MEAGPIELPALGLYSTTIGTLYDAHLDEFCSCSCLKFNKSQSKYSENSVELLENPQIDIELDLEDTFKRKCDILNVNEQLQLNILTGTVDNKRLKGPGRILKRAVDDFNFVQPNCSSRIQNQLTANLVITVTTVEQRLSRLPQSREGKPAVVINDLPFGGTDLVTSVTWGGIVVLQVTTTNDSTSEENLDEQDEENQQNNEEMKEDLKTILQRIAQKIRITDKNLDNNENSETSSFKNSETVGKNSENGAETPFFRLFSDISLPTNFPQGEDEVVQLLSELPLRIRKVNGGKGVPIKYKLTPLTQTSSTCPSARSFAAPTPTVSSEIILSIVNKMEEVREIEKILKFTSLTINEFQNYVPTVDLEFVKSIKSEFYYQLEKLKHRLKTEITLIRNGKVIVEKGESKLKKLLENYDKKEFSPVNIKKVLRGRRIRKLVGYVETIKLFFRKRIAVVSRDQNFRAELLERTTTGQSQRSTVCFVLFKAGCDKEENCDWSETVATFLRLKERESEMDSSFLFVDCQFHPDISEAPQTPKIYKYVDGILELTTVGLSSLTVHETARCAVCSIKPILGTRYKCSVCASFDLCERCHSSQFHKHHKFNQVVNFPRRFPGIVGKTIHTYVVCDGCRQKPIVGFRYKCTVCDNFDLCEKCYWHKLHDFHPLHKLDYYQLFGIEFPK